METIVLTVMSNPNSEPSRCSTSSDGASAAFDHVEVLTGDAQPIRQRRLRQPGPFAFGLSLSRCSVVSLTAMPSVYLFRIHSQACFTSFSNPAVVRRGPELSC